MRELKARRAKQAERRLALGMGKAGDDALVFARADGSPLLPNSVTTQWRSLVSSLKLPKVSLHAWRHTHASQLIASGMDVLTISRRLGHGSPSITLDVYSHLFKPTDRAAAAVFESAYGNALADENTSTDGERSTNEIGGRAPPLAIGPALKYLIFLAGQVAERLNAPHSKCAQCRATSNLFEGNQGTSSGVDQQFDPPKSLWRRFIGGKIGGRFLTCHPMWSDRTVSGDIEAIAWQLPTFYERAATKAQGTFQTQVGEPRRNPPGDKFLTVLEAALSSLDRESLAQLRQSIETMIGAL